MAISVRATGTHTGANTAIGSLNPSTPAGIQTGDLSILRVHVKHSTAAVATCATPSGWTFLASATTGATLATGTDTGDVTVFVFYRISAPASTAVGTLTIGNGNSGGASIVTYANTSSLWNISLFTGGADATSDSTHSITGEAGLGVVAGDWVVALGGVNGDVGTLSAFTIGGMSGATLGTTTQHFNSAVTASNDSRGINHYVEVTAGSSTDAPTYSWTNSSSTREAAVFVRLREGTEVIDSFNSSWDIARNTHTWDFESAINLDTQAGTANTWSRTTGAAQAGTYGLTANANTSGNSSRIYSSLHRAAAGAVLRAHVRIPSGVTATNSTVPGVGIVIAGGDASLDSSNLTIGISNGSSIGGLLGSFGGSTWNGSLASSSIVAGTWYVVEVTLPPGNNDQIVGTLYASDGSTVLDTVTLHPSGQTSPRTGPPGVMIGQGGHVDNLTMYGGTDVLGSVSKNLSSAWDITGVVSDSVSSAWDVLTPVQDTLSSAWDVLTSVPDTLQSAWSVYTAVPDTLQSAWSVAAVVGDSFTSAWDVQAVLTTVADTFNSSWSIAATVEDTFSSAWDVRTVVADTQASAWDVLTPVGQSVSSAWDIATPPELLYASSVVAASVLNAANVVGAMDGTYTTDTAKAWFGIWAMDTLAADYFPETATLYVRARSAVTTGRAYHVWLYEDGKPVEQVVASQSVTTTGTTYSHTVNVGKIRDKTKVQIRVDGDYSSTDSVQLDAIWLEVTPPVGQVRKGLDSSWDINDTANTAATWDFSYPSTTPAPTSVGPGWTVSAWVAGPGLNTGLTASNADNDEVWRAAFTAGAMPTTAYSTEPVARAGSTASGVAAAVSGDKYIEMTFSRTDNGEFTPDAIAFKAARGGASAGRGMVLRSSANSFATDIGTIGSFPTQRPTWTNYDIDLSGIGAVTSLTLRFYIYTDGVASATIEFDDFALTAVPASSTTTVGDSLVSSWDVLTPVADTLPSSWDVLTTVADSQASSWDVLSTVADSQASAWGVAQQITDSINSAWEIRQQITDSINSAWDIRAAVVDSISSAWDIRALVADTLPSSWDVSATVADTLPSSWDVLTTTNDSVNVAWDVLTPVADSVNAAWDVFTSVNDSISSAWEIRQQIIDSINSAWDIRAIVSDSLPSAWDVLATTSDSVTSAWDVYSSVTDSVGSAWDVLTTVSDSTPSAWAVYLLAEDSLSTAWNANQTITDTLPSSWDVYAIGQVSTGFMSAWSLYSVLGDTFTSSWTVHQAVTDSATSAWNVLASVTDQTTSSWNVYGAVAASRNVAWDVYVEVTIGKSSAWSVYEVLGDSLSSAWEVRALAGDSLTTTWEVLALVEDTLPSAWVVYEHGFNSFDTAWDLDGRAVPIPTPPQYPGAVHGPGIYDVRVYHDRMRVVVYERMEASPHARMEVDL